MKCLEDGKVCGSTKKCKDCAFDDCRKALEVLENMKKKNEDIRLKSIKRQLADCCKNCSMLQILDINKQKLYCPYLVKNECLIGSYIKEKKDETRS